VEIESEKGKKERNNRKAKGNNGKGKGNEDTTHDTRLYT
jgi:hypothetical protein